MIRCRGTGASGRRRINRCKGIGAIGSPYARPVGRLHRMNRCREHRSIRWVSDNPMHRRRSNVVHWGRPRGESPVAPDEPMGQNWSVGALTGGLLRTDVKWAKAESSAPDDPTTVGLTRRFIRWHLQKTQRLLQTQCDRMHRCYTFGYSGACAESWVTALNG